MTLASPSRHEATAHPGSPATVAAVDLGSNSFHMIVARLVKGQLHVLDRMSERVALGAGLDEKGRITREAQVRALACIDRFGQRLRDMPPGSVRAVGTNALRLATNSGSFLQKARRALGHGIEIISGREEARLIYLGVSHALSDDAGRRLVVDIGGGSTECILGERFQAIEADSLHMGCVSYSIEHFPGGVLKDARFTRAITAARLELRPIERRYRALGWQSCIGSSGTVLAIEQLLRNQGWTSHGINATGLVKLRRALVAAGSTKKLSLVGLAPDRAPVLAGGLAILIAVFESFEIDSMSPSLGALREGLIHDLLGRIRHEDVRDQTIRRTAERYHVDTEQAARVERTALQLLDQVADRWDLADPEKRQLLAWSARLHEIGIPISYSGYHRHGAYLVANSDMPGFSREDQDALATLIRWHRRKFDAETFRALPRGASSTVLRLCVLLRIAVRLNRSRSPRPLPTIRLRAKEAGLLLAIPARWLAAHPLTGAEMEQEARNLAPLGFRLRLA